MYLEMLCEGSDPRPMGEGRCCCGGPDPQRKNLRQKARYAAPVKARFLSFRLKALSTQGAPELRCAIVAVQHHGSQQKFQVTWIVRTPPELNTV